jgi:hypothetical protein
LGGWRICAPRRGFGRASRGTPVAPRKALVSHARPLYVRELRLGQAPASGPPPALADDLPVEDAGPPGRSIHARSRFRRVDDPGAEAQYTIRAAAPADDDRPAPGEPGAHTLIAVREFRRVPLDASGLALMVLRARPGRAAAVIAALAHWAERAVSLYQPTYLLLARSLEQPSLIALIAGVRERRALQGARATPFSAEAALAEIAPLLAGEPEVYAYCPERSPGPALALAPREVSPYAV